MALFTSSVSLSWSIHDSWTEAFVGTRKLVYELLPSTTFSAKAEDGALCQLALVGANHLMEIAIYKILLPHTKATGQLSILTQKLLVGIPRPRDRPFRTTVTADSVLS